MLRFIAVSIFACSMICAAPIELVLVSGGFKRPVDLTAAPGIEDRLFVTEQTGRIFVIDRESGKRLSEVLDLSDRISRGHNEEGLLGLAFSPNFQKDRRLYAYYTNGKGRERKTRISRFVLDGESLKGDRSKEEVVLAFKQDFGNHNGGWISFGPDGYLYLGVGDGGAANDPYRRAQDLGNLLGSLLRIDVSGKKGYRVPKDNPFVNKKGAKPEIYAYGLRNPWRCAFDRKTNDFWIADVGQNHWEEVNFIKAGELKGLNFGWRPREGTYETFKKGVGGPAPEKAHEPIYEYGHDMSKPTDGLSITGGFVYRGVREDLQGHYFFADYVSLRVWSLEQKDGKMSQFHDHTKSLKLPEGKTLGPISSFAQDHRGELYIVDHTGAIYRMK